MKAGYRTRKRQEVKRKKYKKYGFYVFIAFVAIILIAFFIYQGYYKYLIPSVFEKKEKAQKEELPPVKATFLLVGVKEESKGEKADTIVLLSFNRKKMTINGF